MGDHIIIDGGMCELVVVSKAGPDVLAESIEQGLLLSKANLTFRWVRGPQVLFQCSFTNTCLRTPSTVVQTALGFTSWCGS